MLVAEPIADAPVVRRDVAVQTDVALLVPV